MRSQAITETTKKAQTAPKIKMPPSEEQFTDLIEREQADGLISNECDPVEFFEWAVALKWKINGEPAKNVGDFLKYAEAKHPTAAVIEAIGTTPTIPRLSKVYGIIFKKFHGLRDGDGNTCALVAAIDFLKVYNDGWSLHGKSFSHEQWEDALEEFTKDLKTE